MTQMLLTDAIKRGHERAEACCENARMEVSNWPERAVWYLRGFFLNRKVSHRYCFTAEEAVDFCHEAGLPLPHDERAWGAIFKNAASEGLIRKTNITYRRTKGHGSPAFMWEVV